MSRLTELDCNDNYQILEEDLNEAINKLAEFENTNLTPQEVEQLKHELEVYKRALKSSCDELEKKYMFAQDETTRKIMPLYEYFLDQARKELEDEKKVY